MISKKNNSNKILNENDQKNLKTIQASINVIRRKEKRKEAKNNEKIEDENIDDIINED